MKKGLYALVSGMMLLSFGACSSDEPISEGQDGEVTFTVELPAEAATRAIGDGSSANTLYYAIYDVDAVASDASDAKVYLITGTTPVNGMTATIHTKLVPGGTYKAAFWATNSEGPYTFNPNTMQVTLNTDNLHAGTDKNDGFVGSIASFSGAADNPISVTLERPFAQVNLGTDDYAALRELGMDISNLQCQMVIKDGYTALNVMTGETTGTASGLTFQMAPCPTTETFPQTGYSYLSDVYVLLPGGADAQQLLTVGFTTNEPTLEKAEWTNVPAKRNMRTNIYGSLLTNPTDITVNINPDWLPSFDPTPWDGSSATTPSINEESKTVMLTKSSDIAGLAQMINGGNDLSGYTVMLTGDADMGGHEFPMIGSVTRQGTGITTDSKPMRGNFNGNGHTIKNIKIIYAGTNNDQAVGFIANIDGGTVNNVNFENVTVTAGASKWAGTAVGMITNGGTVSNVNVKSGTVTVGSGGGVVGRIIRHGTIAHCSNAATVTGSIANIGGITGAAYYTTPNEVMTISDCTNTGNVTSSAGVAGGIAGLCAANVSNCRNSGEIKGGGASMGGIVGEQQNYGTIAGCTNTGTVTYTGSDNNKYGFGGIVGWIRYNGSTDAYGLKGIVTVKNCNNSASVTGSNDAGGIIGTVYNFAVVTENSNTASGVHSYRFAAGIVGNYQQDNNYPGVTAPSLNADWCQILNNTSTTTLAAMTQPGSTGSATFRNLVCYVNAPGYVTLSGNKDGNGNSIP